jgi:hypothetical protein
MIYYINVYIYLNHVKIIKYKEKVIYKKNR